MELSQVFKNGIDLFKQKDFSPSSLDITSRQINYWIDKRLLPFVERRNNDKVKHIRLDIYQACWACIIMQLLELGISVSKLQKLTFDVWQKPRLDKYADEVFRKHIEKNPYKLSGDYIKMIKTNLDDELLMENYFRTVINPFTDMIKYALHRKEFPEALIYVPKTGQHIFFHGSKTIQEDLYSIFFDQITINLPLKPIVEKVLGVDLFNGKKKSLQYLTTKEMQIRDIIVYKQPKAVQLVYENDNIKPYVLTEMHKRPEELAKFIMKNSIPVGSHMVVRKNPEGNYKINIITKK